MLTLRMPASGETVILLDVDNTLLDNDRFAADLAARLELCFGASERERYWAILAELRVQTGYVDYLATLQKFRIGLEGDPQLPSIAQFMLEYPFADHLYPRVLETIEYLHTVGLPVILSDGDIVFQPRKIQRSGLWDAVDGRVLVYVNKERRLDAMRRHFPAQHYVMIDDKPQLLAAMKRVLGEKLTTVFVRQGHYAAESVGVVIDPAPDRSLERIGDLRKLDLAHFFAGTPAKVEEQA